MSDETSFDVRIFSPRWGHEDTYQINVSRDHLRFTGVGKGAECNWIEGRDPKWSGYNDIIGNALENILANDSVYPPTVFVRAIESAWRAWRDGTLDNAQLETELGVLCEWLNTITKAKPTTKFWIGVF
jgi:hypothetical protein